MKKIPNINIILSAVSVLFSLMKGLTGYELTFAILITFSLPLLYFSIILYILNKKRTEEKMIDLFLNLLLLTLNIFLAFVICSSIIHSF